MLQQISIKHKLINTGEEKELFLSYELFGQDLQNAPVILVNHALTGNSSFSGENGWWKKLIHHGGTIDLDHYCVIGFNIPGNGYDGQLFSNAKDFTLEDVANIFLKGVKALGVKKLHSIIGGSLGGAIAWQMAYLSPRIAENIIPIATDFKASDWMIAHCHIQDLILNHSDMPLEHARQHAMLLYRTPESLNQRFQNEKDDKVDFKIASWLNYHGDALNKRFSKEAYQMLNQMLATNKVCDDAAELSKIEGNVHIISIDSDLYFTHDRMQSIYEKLLPKKSNTFFHTIESIHGHDAFLIEYDQLNKIVRKVLEDRPKEKVV